MVTVLEEHHDDQDSVIHTSIAGYVYDEIGLKKAKLD